MFSSDRSFCRSITFCAFAASGLLMTSAFAQAPACNPCAPAGVAVAPQHGAVPVAPGNSVYAQQESDRLDNGRLVQRGLTLGVAGAGAAYAAGKVSGAARGVAHVGHVGSAGPWGAAISSLPVVGGAAAGGAVIPTTLGQVPVMGPVVKSVPGVGPIVAGPANPIVVGAVAVDNYVIPKYSPNGYTKSSVIAANNDFNVAPRLLGYKNYLAPMPYTHPPIYSPSTLKTDLPADVAYIDGIAEHTLNNAVALPDM